MIKPFRFTLIACCVLLCSQTVFAKNHPQSLDGIAATVNDSAIIQSEVNEAAKALKAQFNGSNTPLPPADILQKKVLEQVIDRKLQLQAAEQAGIEISDTQIDQTIANIAKENGVTTDVLYEKVASQDLTRTAYRKEIREELTLQQIQQQQVGSKINMRPEEVKNFMHSKEWQTAIANTTTIQEYHVEDLVVLVPDSASTADIAVAKNRAHDLLAKAKEGASYNSLINPAEKTLENNDLGWRKLNELPSAFANQIATAKKGSMIGPIQAGNGFHIIRLVETRQDKNAAANAMPTPGEKEAQQMVYQRKFADALKKWVAKLRSQAVINTHPDSIA